MKNIYTIYAKAVAFCISFFFRSLSAFAEVITHSDNQKMIPTYEVTYRTGSGLYQFYFKGNNVGFSVRDLYFLHQIEHKPKLKQHFSCELLTIPN